MYIYINKFVVISDWLLSYLTLEPFTFAKKLTNYDFKLIKLSEFNPNNIKNSIILFITYDDYNFSNLKKIII